MGKKVIRRHQYADYLNVGTTGTPDWALMGAGFTTLDENPNAQIDTTKYVNEKSSTSSVDSYQTQFPFETHQIADEKAIDAIYKIGRNHLVGEEAELEYCRVELWNQETTENEGVTTPVANTFSARKFVVAVEVSGIAGENKMAISGNLNACGDPVDGAFNTSTKTFTAAVSTD